MVKTGDDGRVVRVHDVARVQLGGLDYSVNSYLGFPNEKDATPGGRARHPATPRLERDRDRARRPRDAWNN